MGSTCGTMSCLLLPLPAEPGGLTETDEIYRPESLFSQFLSFGSGLQQVNPSEVQRPKRTTSSAPPSTVGAAAAVQVASGGDYQQQTSQGSLAVIAERLLTFFQRLALRDHLAKLMVACRPMRVQYMPSVPRHLYEACMAGGGRGPNYYLAFPPVPLPPGFPLHQVLPLPSSVTIASHPIPCCVSPPLYSSSCGFALCHWLLAWCSVFHGALNCHWASTDTWFRGGAVQGRFAAPFATDRHPEAQCRNDWWQLQRRCITALSPRR